MTDPKSKMTQLFRACWDDEALKARFMADPKAVLKEHGLDVPDSMDVKVVENADDCVHITLPFPPAGHKDLSHDELCAAGYHGSSALHGTLSSMAEHKNKLAQVFAACWKDEALKARLMADPKAVLKEHGLDVLDGIDVKVVENADDCVHITLPTQPAGHQDLSDDELRVAAGGTLNAVAELFLTMLVI